MGFTGQEDVGLINRAVLESLILYDRSEISLSYIFDKESNGGRKLFDEVNGCNGIKLQACVTNER